MTVLRLCSVFEPFESSLDGRGARFDPIGGMQNHTAQLTRALAARGVRQHVITHRPPGAPRCQRLGAEAVIHRFGLPLPWARQFYSLPGLVAALRLAPRVDVVHAHLGEDLAVLPLALAASRRAAIPLVVTIHTSLRHTFAGRGPRAWSLKRVGGWIESAICSRAAAVIALTPHLAERLREDGVDAERLHVIPAGVNPAEFDSEPPDPFPDVGHPRVLYVGRLVDQKGVDTLISAVTRMRSSEARVLLVGDGPKRAELELAIRRHGLEKRVRITGFRAHREIPAILQHADIFCLPSRYEELSSALLEAMHAGLPIVATRVGATAETLGSAGRVVAPGDPDALAGALDDLLANPEEAATLGRRAHQRAQRYQWGALADEILALYRRTVAAAGTAALAPAASRV